MLQLSSLMKVFICIDPVDFRRGIDGLSAVCRNKLDRNPMDGTIFVFINKRKTTLKLLVYDGQGFWLLIKRLSQGKYKWWPSNEDISDLPSPIQQCDAGHNIPKDHNTLVAYCLFHARRKFYELVDDYPKIVVKMIGWFAEIFANENTGPPGKEGLLKWHQEKSGPIMDQIRSYGEKLIEEKEVEPNSSMGKAIRYLQNQWEGLTLFLRVPGVPLTNNKTERLLKRAVLNRKNAYFYLTEDGARIGDVLMSTIETCVLNEINPWKYLVAIQKHQDKVRKNPELWVPWAYEKELEKLSPIQEGIAQSQ